MIDIYILEKCKKEKEILQLKIKNMEHAIKQLEPMIRESKTDQDTLIFLRRKVVESRQDLEVLCWIGDQD